MVIVFYTWYMCCLLLFPSPPHESVERCKGSRKAPSAILAPPFRGWRLVPNPESRVREATCPSRQGGVVVGVLHVAHREQPPLHDLHADRLVHVVSDVTLEYEAFFLHGVDPPPWFPWATWIHTACFSSAQFAL